MRACSIDVASVLAPFEHATTPLLRQRELLQRHDAKFSLRAEELPSLLASLRDTHALLLAGDAHIARYDTLYFDTPDLRTFHDHRRGRPHRAKVRIRHYAERRLTFFEVKAKGMRDATDKSRLPHLFGDDVLGADERDLVRRGFGAMADAIEPVLWTRFRRITLLHKTMMERVTIDLDLHFDAPSGADAALDGLVVVEVKQARLDRQSVLMRLLRSSDAMPDPLSKYCAGVVALGLTPRTNGFRARLERMRRVAA